MSSHIEMESKKTKLQLTFVGIGELLCSIAAIGFGFWAFYRDYTRFKTSSGIHIWSGAEVFVCGFFCLMTTTTKKKHQMIASIFIQLLGYILSLSVVGYACKAISVEDFYYKKIAVFNISLVSIATLSLFHFAFGIYFTSKKYINCFRRVSMTSRFSIVLSDTTVNHDAMVIYDYFNNTNITRFYLFSGESYLNPPPLDGAPPPYMAELSSNESVFNLNISRAQNNTNNCDYEG